MTIRGVIFDFGGVLYGNQGGGGLKRFRSELEATYGLPKGSLKRTLKDAACRLNIDEDDSDNPRVLAAAHKDIEALAGHRLPPLHRYWRERRDGSMTPIEANVELAREVSLRYKTAILSNHDGTLQRRLEQLGLTSVFDIVVDTAEELWQKPDPRVYLLTLARLGLEPEEAVYIDNDPEHAMAATSIGMRGLAYDRERDDLRALLAGSGVELRLPASVS